MGVIIGLEWLRMAKFPDPPTVTDFQDKGQPAPSDPWEKWFQAVGNQFTFGPQGTRGTHAQRLKLVPTGIGSMFFETDTTHVFTWSGTAWIQLI